MNQQVGTLLDAHPGEGPGGRVPRPRAEHPADRSPALARLGETLRILVIESDAHVGETLTRRLRRHGYETFSVATGEAALDEYRSADLVLLDPELPDLDGLEVCRAIRAASEVPIIAVSAVAGELDRVLGLQAGADDYVVEPYGFRELTARIEAVMRRARPAVRPTAQVITSGPLTIDPDLREVRLGGRRIDVTRKEFDLLHLLASRPEKVVSRKQLMAQVWEDSWSRPGRTIDTHVSSLRGKLGSADWIITVRGVGFRFGQA
ncbi:response regulator transcription factor [Streptomyces hiroshimensis]|uniref:DNA-binding response regulator n=1 Tax=Streptomyces hiroshimensis TaxID=66424 RepID=A0ABQ2YJC3_9ACTN|nr:response regulator transcription factor [Streptomyces hiroshimensis]GGX86335.1 DNA-binding response regulator [Streptomyces hiroshimensis]